MTRIERLHPKFVENFPARLEPGVLYISLPYKTCGHLCCCGCGEEVVTPLSPAQWAFTYDGVTVTLSPSVGSWALPCRSHYLITHGDVIWSRFYSAEQIESARSADQRALKNLQSPANARASTPRRGWWARSTRR